jgi:hypothetical protein
MLRAWSSIIRQAPGSTPRRRAARWKTSTSGLLQADVTGDERVIEERCHALLAQARGIAARAIGQHAELYTASGPQLLEQRPHVGVHRRQRSHVCIERRESTVRALLASALREDAANSGAKGVAVDRAVTRETVFWDVMKDFPERTARQAVGRINGVVRLTAVAADHAPIVEDDRPEHHHFLRANRHAHGLGRPLGSRAAPVDEALNSPWLAARVNSAGANAQARALNEGP